MEINLESYVTGFVVFLKEFIALYYCYIELFTRKI